MSTVLTRRQPKRSRTEWVELVQPLRAEGMNHSEIARELGISHSFASSIVNDPDGSKDRARKRQYRAVCDDCGGPCYPAASRCESCQIAWQRDQKYWTRERVLDAIRRFAAEHGRPPTSKEWIASDPENGYPPLSQVYRSSASHQSPPFASWADAIEAAGFDRPTIVYARAGLAGLGWLERAALELVQERGSITSTELGAAQGTHRQNAHRALQGLVRRGLMSFRRDSGKSYIYELVKG